MGSVFLSFALGCSHLPKNSILSAKRQFSAHFSNCSNSLNFEAKINCNTNKSNVPKWRKRCTGLKLDLGLFNGPQMLFLSDHNFEGPCKYILKQRQFFLLLLDRGTKSFSEKENISLKCKGLSPNVGIISVLLHNYHSLLSGYTYNIHCSIPQSTHYYGERKVRGYKALNIHTPF